MPCLRCGIQADHEPCSSCGRVVYIGDWPFCPHGTIRQFSHSVHPSQRAVVYENPKTGQVVYPPRNDQPIPERYRKQGYVRRELGSLRALEKFEKEKGVGSEIAHFDRGSGRGFDDGPAVGEMPKEVYDLVRQGKIGIRTRGR